MALQIDGIPQDDRASRIDLAVYDFLSRRNQGETLSTEDYAVAHADLMPELAVALEAGLKFLRQANDVRRAHETAPQSDAQTISGDLQPRPRVPGYQLTREISGGGQGTVFEAVQEATGRTVAVKVVNGVSRSSVVRFEREVHVMASVDHPGIVGVMDRGRTADDAYFLVMEYVRGYDWDSWVKSVLNQPGAQRTIVEALAKIALAIETAHAKGIVHRDLKPSNIRITPLGEPCIIDFGLAHLTDLAPKRHLQELTQTGNIVGSIPWASPEQAGGGASSIGPSSDVYALGVMLYHALTGRFPYAVDGPLHQTVRNICDVVPVSPLRIKRMPSGKVDEVLSSILMKCLAKKPSARFASGEALASALKGYLDGSYHETMPHRFGRLVTLIGCVALIGVSSWALFSPNAASSDILKIKLPTITNSIGMQFVQIPIGGIAVGSGVIEQGHSEDEQRHLARIKRPFYLGITEVTRAQYRRVMGSLPPQVGSGSDNLPVNYVDRNDATAFCKKLGKIESRTYRLPSEIEWEYACRAGSGAMYAGSGHLDDIAWFKDNSGGHLHPVSTRSPNHWGLYDMEGNAREWVGDNYIPFLGYGEVSEPIKGPPGNSSVLRGGSMSDFAEHCRSASRSPVSAFTADESTGFRVAIEIDLGS